MTRMQTVSILGKNLLVGKRSGQYLEYFALSAIKSLLVAVDPPKGFADLRGF